MIDNLTLTAGAFGEFKDEFRDYRKEFHDYRECDTKVHGEIVTELKHIREDARKRNGETQ